MSERVAQVRGVLAERMVVSSALDPFLSLRALAAYSSLSVRTLRGHVTDLAHPLPCYRLGAKILVRRSEFDTWMLQHRHVGSADVARLMAEVFPVQQPARTR